MSLKKVDEVKKDRGFKLLDLIVYGAIAAIVAALFIVIFATRDTSPLAGVRVFVGGEAVLEYDFESGKYSVLAPDIVQVEEGDRLEARITVDNGYNLIVIDPEARTAEIAVADCRGRDCVYTPAITDNNGIIYCSPHSLRIEPFNLKYDDTVIM